VGAMGWGFWGGAAWTGTGGAGFIADFPASHL